MEKSQHIAATAVAARKAALGNKPMISGWITYRSTLPPMNVQERDEILAAYVKAYGIVASQKGT